MTKLVFNKEQIAIIGAGIGGTSCAYFLRELYGDNVEIDVYEKGTVGGRLATTKYGSEEYELGGSVIHARNKYMSSFANQFGLGQRTSNPGGGGGLAILNGNTTEFVTSDWKAITLMKLFLRYGLSLYRLNTFVNDMLNSFDRIYELQSKMIAFETVAELLQSMDPIFVSYLNTSTSEGFKKYGRMNDRLIFELVQATLRVNYGQTVDAQTFVGAVSVAGIGESLWSVKGGNKLVAEECLGHSKANFYNYKVDKIFKLTEEDKFVVQVSPDGEKGSGKRYDSVIVAAPITDDTRNGLEFVGFADEISVPGRYHETVATILRGRLKKSRFGQYLGSVDCFINLNTDDIYNSLGVVKSVLDGDQLRNDSKVAWKIFSQRTLTGDEINGLFDDVEIVKVVDWLAYPHYQPRRVADDSFILADKLYYVNAVEWAASAMEMSVLSAKNIALLAFKRSAFVSASKTTSTTRRVELR